MATVQEITQQLLRGGGRTATSDFGRAFQQSEGRAPTQDELNQFTQFRSSYTPPQQVQPIASPTSNAGSAFRSQYGDSLELLGGQGQRSTTPNQSSNTGSDLRAIFGDSLNLLGVKGQRPVTPAPTSITDTGAQAQRTDNDILQSLISKSLQSRYGDSLTSDEIDYLSRYGISGTQSSTADLEAAQRQQEQRLADMISQQEGRLTSETERLRAERESRLADLEKSLREQQKADIAEAQRSAGVRTSQEERLLGSRGNLTSTVGAERLGDIERDLSNTISAINAATQAKIAFERAQAEGADQATLDKLSNNLFTLQQQQINLLSDNAAKLQAAKQEAATAGDTARMNMIQSALDGLSLKKVASEFDKDLTQQINDGFIYDKNGNKLTDAEGGYLKFTPGSGELDELLSVAEAKSLGVPYGTTKAGALGITPTEVTDPQQLFTNIRNLRNDFQGTPVIKDLNEIRGRLDVLDRAMQESQNSGSLIAVDQALITTFNKLLDPTSVVRESEYARTASDQSFLNLLKGKWEKIQSGGAGLTQDEREAIARMGREFANAAEQRAQPIIQQYTNDAIQIGVDPNRIIGGIGEARTVSAPMTQEQQVFAEAKNTLGRDPTRQEMEEILQRSITEQEFASFNNDLSTSQNGSVAQIASAIGQYESGGNYQARGPVVQSGQYAGERAMGKYQIMPGNLPQWSREALGREVSEQEFMNNPSIQDQIAMYQMNKIYSQHGTAEDVASVWFSGQPLARAGNARDVIGTTVPQYVQNVISLMGNYA